MKRYKKFFEAFSEKDMERAVQLIKNQLEKRLDVSLERVKDIGRFRKKRGAELFSLKYVAHPLDLYITFNWAERTGKNISSVEISTGEYRKGVSIDTLNMSAVEILKNIQGVFVPYAQKRLRKLHPRQKNPRRVAKGRDIAEMQISKMADEILAQIEAGWMSFGEFMDDPRKHMDSNILRNPMFIKAVIKRVREHFQQEIDTTDYRGYGDEVEDPALYGGFDIPF